MDPVTVVTLISASAFISALGSLLLKLYEALRSRTAKIESKVEFVSNVVEKDLAHPCSELRFTSRCQNSLTRQMTWQGDVPQLLRMT